MIYIYIYDIFIYMIYIYMIYIYMIYIYDIYIYMLYIHIHIFMKPTARFFCLKVGALSFEGHRVETALYHRECAPWQSQGNPWAFLT